MRTTLLIILSFVVLSQAACCLNSTAGYLPPCSGEVQHVEHWRFYKLVNGAVLYGNVRLRLKEIEDPGGEQMYRCTGSLGQKACEEACLFGQGRVLCSGDQHFCRGRSCTPASQAPCSCNSVKVKKVQQAFTNGEWVRVHKSEVVKVGVRSPPSPSASDLRKAARKAQAKTSNAASRKLLADNVQGDNIMCNFDVKVDLITVSCTQDAVAIVEKDTWRVVKDVSAGPTTIPLPADQRVTSGLLKLSVYQDGELIYDENKMILGTVLCPSSDCAMCWDTVQVIGCQPPAKRFGVVTGMLLLSIFALATLWWFLAYVWILVSTLDCCVRCTSKVMARFCCCKKATSNKKSDDHDARPSLERGDSKEELVSLTSIPQRGAPRSVLLPHEIEAQRLAARESRRVPVALRGQSGLSTITLGVITLVTLLCLTADACNSGLFLPVNSDSCTNDGSSITCTASFDLAFSIAQPGADVCVTLGDLDKKIPLGELRLSYNALESTYGLSLAYYTSCWYATTASSHYCYKSGPCDGDNCSSVSANDPTALGVFDDPILVERPGISSCRASCQCAGCGCFYCVSSCVFERWSINPTGAINAVYTVSGNPVVKPRITVSVDNKDLFIGPWEFSGKRVFEDWELELVGVLSAMPPVMTQLGVTNDGSVPTLRNISPVNAPQANLVGDIQSGTMPGILSPGLNSFIFDPTMPIRHEGEHDTQWEFPECAIRQPPIAVLPGVYQGNYWTYQDTKLMANLSQPAALLFNLRSLKPITFTQNINSVCPSATLVTASGCKTCDQGFTLVIKAKSTCQPGTALVQTDDEAIIIYTRVVKLTSQDADIIISGATPYVNNAFNVWLSNGDKSAKVPVTFVAPEMNNVKNMTWVRGTVVHDDKTFPVDLGFFQSLFDNIFGRSWLSFFMTILALIAGGLFVIYFGPAIFRFIRKFCCCCRKKESDKTA